MIVPRRFRLFVASEMFKTLNFRAVWWLAYVTRTRTGACASLWVSWKTSSSRIEGTRPVRSSDESYTAGKGSGVKQWEGGVTRVCGCQCNERERKWKLIRNYNYTRLVTWLKKFDIRCFSGTNLAACTLIPHAASRLCRCFHCAHADSLPSHFGFRLYTLEHGRRPRMARI